MKGIILPSVCVCVCVRVYLHGHVYPFSSVCMDEKMSRKLPFRWELIKATIGRHQFDISIASTIIQIFRMKSHMQSEYAKLRMALLMCAGRRGLLGLPSCRQTLLVLPPRVLLLCSRLLLLTLVWCTSVASFPSCSLFYSVSFLTHLPETLSFSGFQ
jgi:hypothetical protein